MNRGTKIGRVITAIIFILFAIFCLMTLKVQFTIGFLFLMLVSLAIAGFSLYKAFGTGKSAGGRTGSSKSSDNFDL